MALTFDKIFALVFDKVQPQQKQTEVPDDVRKLVELRSEARKQKNWAESDRLRDEIAKLGYSVKDTANGPEVEKK